MSDPSIKPWHGEAGSWWRPSRRRWCWHALQGFADWELREVHTLDDGPPFIDMGSSVRMPTFTACKLAALAIDDIREQATP